MPLSVNKLEKLLSLQGFIPKRYFIIDKYIVYIEIVSIKDATIFLMYIPSKYNIPMETCGNVHKLKYVDVADGHLTSEDVAGEPDDIELEKSYNPVQVISPQRKGQSTIAEHLEENYKKDIDLKEIASQDLKEIKNIYRQLKRLRLCVQSVKYKIAIVYKRFLCTVKRDNSLECYSIKHFGGKKNKKMYITIDLELFYEKMDSLIINMNTVRKELFHILERNQKSHGRILNKLLEDKNELKKYSNKALSKKNGYDEHIKELECMLETINDHEKLKVKEIYELENNPATSMGIKGFHKDIDKSQRISILNEELSKLCKVKQNVVTKLFEVTEIKEDTMLSVDKIMFDNTIMLECMLRNFGELSKYI